MKSRHPDSVSYWLLRTLIAAFLIASAFAACTGKKETQDQIKEINVAAAANLTDAFTELAKEYTSRTGNKVVFSFGATADLARQIENNAPFDLFASADVENVERLAKKGLLSDGTQRLYARGRLVLWSPPGARKVVVKLEELSNSDVERIGIAKPDIAPYGRASVEALKALSLWEKVEPKVVYGQNVSLVRQFAATGNVDAAFIPKALVRAGDTNTIDVDENLHQPINQAMAIIKASPRQEEARRFLDFVMSPEAQALLERYGYRKP
jgi:molybdate transport system substrate-binding protein